MNGLRRKAKALTIYGGSYFAIIIVHTYKHAILVVHPNYIYVFGIQVSIPWPSHKSNVDLFSRNRVPPKESK